MVEKSVPVLIPQAWIQWHSFPKKNLRSTDSLHVDDIYRVDFVAFWNNQRFCILVDDISHYAVKNGKKWLADEESYSKRLKEDRKLRKEGWQVFRVSNWELQSPESIDDILGDLQNCFGFE
jgi:very-short-patch-repair endonuclease